MAVNIIKRTKFFRKFFDEATPVNAVKATGALTISGVVIEGETFIINGAVGEFNAGGGVTAGNIDVDISANTTASQGTLTVDTQPLDSDTMTIGATAYTFKTDGTEAIAGDISAGVSLATAQANIISAIAGTDTLNSTNASAKSVAFIADDLVITAISGGVLGDTITSTETFTTVVDEFDAVTLGTTTAGVDGVASQGTLTIGVQPTNLDTFTIGASVYLLVTDGAEANPGDVSIGTDLPSAKTNIVSAITGNALNTANASVSIGTFAVDILTLTAIATGVAGDLIDTTSTFANGGNLFNGLTLGTTTAGVDEVASQGTMTIEFQPKNTNTMLIGATTYTFKTDGTESLAGDISIGTNLATAQANILNAIAGTDALNGANASVTAGAFSSDDSVLTAIAAGVAGDLIDTTETFATVSNEFDAATLGTTTAGVDCVQADAVTDIVAVTDSFTDVVLTDEAGDVVGVTAVLVGTEGNAITTTETMANGAFGGVVLSGGLYATLVSCACEIEISGVIYVTDRSVSTFDTTGWYSCTKSAI